MWASLVSVLIRVTGSSGLTVGETLSSGKNFVGGELTGVSISFEFHGDACGAIY